MAQDPSREIRFGLVLYGGVSLAVYMNGVMNEFLRMVRGKGVYKLIKWITDTELMVDIVSGTSAGGINGVFFAHALINNLDFGEMEQLWRRCGDIARLLRPLGESEDRYKSLLDSEGYYEPQLKHAFESMQPTGEPFELGDLELDLFVTGTDMKGLIYTVLDDQGHAVDVKDQRAVFWLKHRPYQTQFPLLQDNFAALARLCRLTSCFPAAFAPVLVSQAETGPDALLQDWGQLNRSAYFMDGGLLANKPFSHTIQAIRTRPVSRPAERVLCYVEPDPEHFPKADAVPAGQGTQAAEKDEPAFLSATFDGAYNIPTYQGIAEDLKRISEHNAQVNRYRQVCSELKGKLASLFVDAALPQGAGIPDNLRDPERTVYTRSRLACMGMRAIRGLAAHQGRKSRLGKNHKLKAEELIKGLIEMEARAAEPGRRPVLTDANSIDRFDIYFRLRRLRHVLYYIAERSKVGAVPNAWTQLRTLLNARIQSLEIIRYWMEYILDHVLDPDNMSERLNWLTMDAGEIWGNIRWFLERFLNSALDAPRDDHKALHAQLGEIAKDVCQLIPTGIFLDPFEGLLQWTDQDERAAFAGALSEFLLEYDQFVALDAVVFPIEYISDLESRDLIRILRLSPVDAQGGFAKRELKDKLAGVSVGHFGGFLNRSWRSNDVMWGRLDAISELLKQILTRERLEDIIAAPALRQKVRDSIGEHSAHIQDLFPASSATSAHEVFGWINDLFNPGRSNDAIDRLDAMVNLITEMAQLEVLLECVPKVIGDAKYEQVRWAPGGNTDPQASVAAAQAEKAASAQFRDRDPHGPPSGSSVGNFFLHDYQLAPASLQEAMPPLAAAEVFSQAGLVLRNCVFGGADSGWRKAIQGSRPFKFGVDWPLRMTHSLARLWRREPRLLAIMWAVFFSVSLVTLALTYKAGWQFAKSNFILCVVLPLFVLLVQYAFALRRWSTGVTSAVAILLAVALAHHSWEWIEAHVALVRAVEAGVDAFRRAII